MEHFGIALFFLINVFWVNAININPEVQKKVEKTRIIAYNKLQMREIDIVIEINRIEDQCQCHVENLSGLGAFILTYNNKTHLDSTHQTVDFLDHIEMVDVEDQVITINNQKIPEDPSFNKQWSLNGEWSPNAHINAGNGWWEYRSDVIGGNHEGPPVIVAVVDTGVDYKHEDLTHAMWTNPLEIPDNGIDDDGNIKIDDIYGWDFNNNDDSDPIDKNGHGTHCAGIIGAKENNCKGIAGVTSFSHGKVKIMAIKALPDDINVDHTSSTDFKQALDYAILNGATISSNSWRGVDKSFSEDDLKAWKSHFENNPEHLFVFAAGNKKRNINDNNHLEFMMCGVKAPNLLCVASSNLSDTISDDSNYGKDYVHVFAPGYHIYSTTQNNQYDIKSGTSMACPHVAGLAALIKTLRPNLNGQQLREAIEKNVQKNKNYENLVSSGGKVDMEKTIRAFRTKPKTCASFTATPGDQLDSGCSYPEELTDGMFSCKSDGSICHIICNEGFKLETSSPDRYIECTDNSWNVQPDIFKCVPDCCNRRGKLHPACQDEVIFIAGGISPLDGSYVSSGYSTTSSELVDVAPSGAEFYRVTSQLPNGRYGHSMDLLNGKLVICGGSRRYTSCIAASSPSGPWIEHPPTTGERYGHGSSTVGGAIHLIGGMFSDSMEAWQNDGWITKKKPPVNFGQWTCATKVGDNEIFVIGGTGSENKVALYRVKEDEWEELELPANERWNGHGCVSLGDRQVLVGGGRDSFQRFGIYHIGLRTWEDVGFMQSLRDHVRFVAVNVAGKRRFFALGGESYIAGIEDSIEEFDQNDKVWRVSSVRLAERRKNVDAVVLKKKNICP